MVYTAYLEDIIRRAKPGKDVSRSSRRIPHTWKGHARGILEAIHPNRHDEDPNKDAQERFSTWLKKENLHIRKEIVLQRSMRASGFHAGYINLCKHPYAPECCLELIDNLSHKHKGTWGDVAGWVVELSQLPGIDTTHHSTMSIGIPYTSVVSFCMPKSVHSRKTDILLLSLLKETGFKEVKRLSKDLPRFRKDLSKIYPLICISNRPKLRRDLYIHMSVNEGFDLKQSKNLSVLEITAIINKVAGDYEYTLSDGPLKLENPLAQIAKAVLTITDRKDDAKLLWDGLSRAFTNESNLDRLIHQDRRFEQIDHVLGELARSAKTADVVSHQKNLRMRTVNVLNYVIAFVNKLNQCPEGDDASKLLWWFSQTDNDQMSEFMLDVCRTCGVRNDKVKSKKDMHHASPALTAAKYVCSKVLKGMLPVGVVEYMSSFDLNRVTNCVSNKRVSNINPEKRILTAKELDGLQTASSSDVRESLLIGICRDLALRRGAVNRLMYKDIFDSNHAARCLFSVVEKGKRIRECDITRAHTLLEQMKEFSLALRKELQGHSIPLENVYIFNKKTPLKKPSYGSCIPKMLEKISVKAGIDPSRVSCHIFRHTKVVNLARSGNDILRISKFFCHARPETTQQNYDIRGFEEVVKDIKNVYDRNPEEVKKEESFTEGRLDYIKHQRKLAEDLLFLTIDELRKNGVMESLIERVPDLEERLSYIRDERYDAGMSSVTTDNRSSVTTDSTNANVKGRLEDFVDVGILDEDSSGEESSDDMDEEEDESPRKRPKLEES
jgi:site-specific recombinase XerD